MAVTNDGNGNYFSGDIGSGVNRTTLSTDIQSALTTLGVSYLINPSNNGRIAYRPNGDTLTGSIGAFGEQWTIVSNTASTLIPDQSRIQMMIGEGQPNNTLFSVFVGFNSSSNNTEVNARLSASSAHSQSWYDNVINHASAIAWAVVTNAWINVFYYKDASNYLFVGSGYPNNKGSYNNGVSHPVGFYTGKCAGTKSFSFGVTETNSSTITALKSGGTLNDSASMNYDLTQNSGMFLCRRNDTSYAIGNTPNLVVIKNQTGYAINKTVGLNNITQGNQSILGSTENVFKLVGRLDSTSANDDAGYWIGMRIKKV
jgi:hypothetical protein